MSNNTWEIHSEAAMISGVALELGDRITDGTDTQTVMLFVATSLNPPVIFTNPKGGAGRVISFDQFTAGWKLVDTTPHPLKAGIVPLDNNGVTISGDSVTIKCPSVTVTGTVTPISTPPAPNV